jgi:antitoxin YefM
MQHWAPETMIDIHQDTQTLSSFKRNPSQILKNMKKTRRPIVLTDKGKTVAVLLPPSVYRSIEPHLETMAAVRRGLRQALKGIGSPVDEVFDMLEKE